MILLVRRQRRRSLRQSLTWKGVARCLPGRNFMRRLAEPFCRSQ